MLKKIVLLAASSSLAAIGIVCLAQTSTAARAGDAKAAMDVYTKNCQRCHGEHGKGDGPAGKLLKTKPADWTDKARMSKMTDNDLKAIFKYLRAQPPVRHNVDNAEPPRPCRLCGRTHGLGDLN